MENGANYLVSNAEEGHLDVVKDLLLNQADINATRKSLAGEDVSSLRDFNYLREWINWENVLDWSHSFACCIEKWSL